MSMLRRAIGGRRRRRGLAAILPFHVAKALRHLRFARAAAVPARHAGRPRRAAWGLQLKYIDKHN